VTTQETFFFLKTSAAAESFDNFAVHHERSARVAVAGRDFGIPNPLAVAGVDFLDAVSARQIKLVLVKRDAAHRDISTEVVLPNHLASGSFECLQDAAGVGKIDDAVVNDRSRLVGTTLVHGRLP